MLGSTVAELLAGSGHRPLGVDFRPPADVVCDVRGLAGALTDLADAEAFVHLAALHGRDHRSRFSDQDFWQTNVEGTEQLYQVAARLGVPRVVLASTMAVYGPVPAAPDRQWRITTEQAPLVPHDDYAATKIAAEQIAQRYARDHGITTVVLRFGHFAPSTIDHYGFRLLFGGVDVRDAAAAVIAAAELAVPAPGVRAYNVHASSVFQASDLARLEADPVAALRSRRSAQLTGLEQLGISPGPLLWGRGLWPIDKALGSLGWHPRWDFDAYASARLAGDVSGYANLAAARWGIG